MREALATRLALRPEVVTPFHLRAQAAPPDPLARVRQRGGEPLSAALASLRETRPKERPELPCRAACPQSAGGRRTQSHQHRRSQGGLATHRAENATTQRAVGRGPPSTTCPS